MTNHLKFRIWDKALKKWVESYSAENHSFTETFIGLNGLVERFDAGFPDGEDKPLFEKQLALTYPNNEPWFTQKRYVVQQFTGLKDMDGKDIYEGDLLNGHYFGFDGNETDNIFERGEVMRSQWASFGIQAHQWFDFRETSHFQEPCLRVVGNIFEKL